MNDQTRRVEIDLGQWPDVAIASGGRVLFRYGDRWVPVFAGGDGTGDNGGGTDGGDQPGNDSGSGTPAGGTDDPATGTDPAPGDADPGDDPDALKRTVHERTKEAAKYRNRLREVEQELKKFQDAQKSEVEKLRDELDAEKRGRTAADERLRMLAMDTAILREATTMQAIDPDAVVALIDRDAIELDDDGNARRDSVQKALKALFQAKPYLVGKSGGGGRPESDRTGMSLDDVRRMTPEQIAALPDDQYQAVQKLMAGSPSR